LPNPYLFACGQRCSIHLGLPRIHVIQGIMGSLGKPTENFHGKQFTIKIIAKDQCLITARCRNDGHYCAWTPALPLTHCLIEWAHYLATSMGRVNSIPATVHTRHAPQHPVPADDPSTASEHGPTHDSGVISQRRPLQLRAAQHGMPPWLDHAHLCRVIHRQ
jgi:hypothetical protein